MVLLAVGSLGGSPGATTVSLALASQWPHGKAVMVEADAAGGTVAAWRRMPTTPGLVDLAATGRHRPSSLTSRTGPLGFAQEVPGGVWVCVAPVAPNRAGPAVHMLAHNPAVLHEEGGAVVVVDVGRISPRSLATHLAAECDALVLVVRAADLAQVKRAAESVPGLEAGVRQLGLAVTGHGESAREVAGAIGAPLWGHIPDDPRGAAIVRGDRAGRGGRVVLRGVDGLAETAAQATLWTAQTHPAGSAPVQPGGVV